MKENKAAKCDECGMSINDPAHDCAPNLWQQGEGNAPRGCECEDEGHGQYDLPECPLHVRKLSKDEQAFVGNTGEGNAPRGHEKTAMEVDGRDYVTYRLGGKRCHHKIRFVCMECGATKAYFENLMGYRGNPTCDGIIQKLSTPMARE